MTDTLLGEVHESAGLDAREKPPTPEEAHDKALHQEILDNYDQVRSVESEQRAQEDEDLYFEGVTPWQQSHLDSRAAQTDPATGRSIPARPALSINLVEQPVQRVIGEAREAKLAITVQPKAGIANTKQAGWFKGLIRSIQVESGATEARLWALERVAKCGRGAYEIDTEFANDGDFDLDIVYRRILDQGTVGWDVYSVMADRRDADWCFAYTMWMSEKVRQKRWPTKPVIASPGAFENEHHPWFALDANGTTKSVLVVVYFKVVYTKQVLAFHPAIGPMLLDQMPPELQQAVAAGAPGTRTREVDARSVLKVFADGSQILESHHWNGRYIPIIPVTGKEYLIKGKRSWKGIVTNSKDVNRGYVVTISSAVEMAGSMPRAPYIMYAGQDEGFEEMWDDSPIKSYSRLYVNLLEVNGKAVPFPQRQNLEPQIQGVLLLARVLKDDVSSLTGSVDPAQRAVNPYDRSGKAIEALNRQGAAGTSNFLDNLATISMPHEGRVMVDLIPKIYDKPGRVVRVMGEENDDQRAIMIKRPFTLDAEGNPVAVPCPLCLGKGTLRALKTLFQTQTCPACQGSTFATKETMPPEWQGKRVEYVDLSEGEFTVTTSIGRNFATKQEEAMASMTELAKAAPELVPVYADLWVRAMGFSGSNEIGDRIKKMNPNAAADDEEMRDVPPAFAAKYQQLQLQHQQAMEQLQLAAQALETDEVKTAGQKQIAAMKIEAATGLEHLRQQAKLMAETEKGETAKELQSMKADLAQMLQESKEQHEVLLELLQAKHAMAQQRDAEAHAAAADGAKHAHEASSQARDQQHETIEGARARQHETAEQQRARQHASGETQRDRQHETAEEGRARQHESTEEARTRQHADQQQRREHDHQATQAEKTAQHAEKLAAMKPKPTPKA